MSKVYVLDLLEMKGMLEGIGRLGGVWFVYLAKGVQEFGFWNFVVGFWKLWKSVRKKTKI